LPETKITFYGGIDEIGGNKILVENKGTRIFLDFGKSFSRRSKYYDWIDKPRLANGIGDLLELDIIPDISGIYRSDLLALCGRNAKEEKAIDAVVLSHAHADHADYVSLLREDIPIYMGEITRTIISSIEDERNSDIEFEITEFKKRPIDRKEDPIPRDIRTFRTGKNFSVDSITVKPVHVDHSIPGCYGFVINTSDSTIVYSGDLRYHGNRSDLTKDFVAEASKEKADVMLCEGTRINETAYHTEKDVHDACRFFVEQARESFVFADYSYKDIDRFVTFYTIAKETGRKLLIGIKAAKYLQALKLADPTLQIPDIDDANIGIYRPRELNRNDKVDEFYKKHTNVWTSNDVRREQSKVIATMSSAATDELIDIRPTKGLYIQSSSEPFNEEAEIDEERMRKWLDKFGLEKVRCHCSGHGSGMELGGIVNAIDPKLVVPIHTETPGIYPILFGNRVKFVKQFLEI
jgi:ribonuclease J